MTFVVKPRGFPAQAAEASHGNRQLAFSASDDTKIGPNTTQLTHNLDKQVNLQVVLCVWTGVGKFHVC